MRSQLLDVHSPGRFFDGEVHWQMASGHDAIDVSVTASALHALSENPLPGYLEVFETHRDFLCALAATKLGADNTGAIKIDRKDLPSSSG